MRVRAYNYVYPKVGEKLNIFALVIGNGSAVVTVIGTIVGLLGLVGVGVNYPIYKKLLDAGKKKYAFEIMQLAKEISESAE